MSKCAACGKGGDNLKACTSCEQVSYCNAKCRNAHRSKHKKACKQYAAERRNKNAAIRAEVDAIIERFSKIEISDEELFADPPPKEDCEICFLPMPCGTRRCKLSGRAGLVGITHKLYQSCCGKRLCLGCMRAADDEMKKGTLKRCCPFCRLPLANSDNEDIQRVKKRIKLKDGDAFLALGVKYYDGTNGLPQDYRKAFELFNRGAEVGSVGAHCFLANAYLTGQGVEKDEEKSDHHLMLAAIKGNEVARHMLGLKEWKIGNKNRAMKHYIIAARCGYDNALKEISEGYKAESLTKDEYASTLRAYQDSRDEMKSEQRTKAREQMA